MQPTKSSLIIHSFFRFPPFHFLSYYHVLLIAIREFFARAKMSSRVRLLLCKYIFYVCWWLCSVTHSDWILRSGYNNATHHYVANVDINRIYMIHSCILHKTKILYNNAYQAGCFKIFTVKLYLFCKQEVIHEK